MKCDECGESNANEQCKVCGTFYCEDCAENRHGFCDCEIPPTIYPVKKVKPSQKTEVKDE